MPTVRGLWVRLVLIGILAFAKSAAAKNYTVIDVVGDSVSADTGADIPSPVRTRGWVEALYGIRTSEPPLATECVDDLWPAIHFYNSAVRGSTAADWASTSTTLLKTVLDHHPDLVFVLIGGNDFLQAAAKGEITQQDFDTYRANLETIVDRLQANHPTPDIILLDYFDPFDGLSAFVPLGLAPLAGLSAAAFQGHLLIQEVAQQKGTYFVSLYHAFFNHAYGEFLGDPGHLEPDYFPMDTFPNIDIHPATEGHRAIYDLVLKKLFDLKDAPSTDAHSWTHYR